MHALEMAALLLDVQPGDEFILPSIRPDTLNLNEELLAGAVSPRTKAIVLVHDAGVGCEWPPFARWRSAAAFRWWKTMHMDCSANTGSAVWAPFGCRGALIVNDGRFLEQAGVLREKGRTGAGFSAAKWISTRFGGYEGQCPVTESVSARLLRLPFYNDLSEADRRK